VVEAGVHLVVGEPRPSEAVRAAGEVVRVVDLALGVALGLCADEVLLLDQAAQALTRPLRPCPVARGIEERDGGLDLVRVRGFDRVDPGPAERLRPPEPRVLDPGSDERRVEQGGREQASLGADAPPRRMREGSREGSATGTPPSGAVIVSRWPATVASVVPASSNASSAVQMCGGWLVGPRPSGSSAYPYPPSGVL
jgi:hypothetical protein